MIRFALPLVVCGSLLFAGLPLSASQESGKRALPLRRFASSRQAQQDKNGFYRQAVALCDDYPEESRTDAKVRRDMETLRAAGISLLRCGIAWGDIERAPGQYDWKFWDRLVELAGQYHVRLIPYVCYTPEWLAAKPENFWRQTPRDLHQFADFVYAIAHRYRGKITSWELWNEPDNHEFWEGTVAQFAQMVREGAQAVRRADPKAVVVLGGMAATYPTPFFQTLKSEFQIENTVDVVNFHGYHETWNSDRLERYPDQITAMAQALQQPGPIPDLWLAEFGYSNYRFAPNAVSQGGVPVTYAYEHTPAYQAVALFKAHVLALSTSELALTAWYRINDLKPAQNVIGDDNNKFLGVLDVAGAPKPAFYVLRFYVRLFNQPTRCLDDAVKIQKPDGSQSEVHCFARKNGSLIVTAWLRSPRPGEVADHSGMASDTRRETISLTFPGRKLTRITHYRENGEIIEAEARMEGSTLADIPLSGERLFVAEIDTTPSS